MVFVSEDQAEAEKAAWEWHDKIYSAMAEDEKGNVLDPQEPYMSKINENYRFSMLIKCPKGKRKEYTNILAKVREEDKSKKKKNYTAVVDINPYSFS